MKKFLAVLSSFAVVLGVYVAPFAAHAATAPSTTIVALSSIQAGDLVRSPSYSAVYYYGYDGFRYVFPNDKTYFTWYKDFSGVKMISDADMGTIQIGGNVTYKPGVRMLKIESDPKTYAVDAGGTLRWVSTEAVAVALYGGNWNTMIDDVPDAFFPNYKQGQEIDSVSDFNVTGAIAAAIDIDHDKDLKAPAYISINDNAFSPATVTVTVNSPVKITNTGTETHTATADDLTWGSGPLTPGQSFSRYFKTAGTYTYTDTLYPTLKGTIIVQ